MTTRTYTCIATGLLAGLTMCQTSFGAGRILITEIMYNPNSREDKGQSEWVEIANVGDEAVELKNWRLDDEDRWDWGKISCTLEPGGIAVLFNSDYLSEADFREAWDGGEHAIPLNYQAIGIKWGGIANTPSAENEILQLLDDKGEVVCEVRQAGEWPDCSRPDGSSIYLADLSVSGLSDPGVWEKSDRNIAGARTNARTEIFNGTDIGSPGYVPGLDSAPVAAAPSSGSKPKPKTAKKPEAKPQDKPAASQPATRPDNTIDY